MSYLVQNMVDIAKNEGFKTSIAQCYNTSLRLAQKIGFKTQAAIAKF